MNCSYNVREKVVSKNGVDFYIIHTPEAENERHYGILAEMSENKDDFGVVETLFFTKEETTKYCKWLAKNEVEPIVLRDVLTNIFYLD